jgi:hypothetical protein
MHTTLLNLYDHKRSGNVQLFYGNKCAVFSTEEEGKLTDYTTTARNINYELTRKEVMKLPYQFAKVLTKKYYRSRDVND